MNTKQAIDIIKNTVTNCDQQRFDDIFTILEKGAGNIFLTERTDEDKRHAVIMELVDSVHYSTCNEQDEYQPDAEFIPVFSGSWELVLASLIIDEDWSRIAQTAKELREEN